MIGWLAAGLVAGCSTGDPLASEEGDAGDGAVLESSYGALTAEFSYPRSVDEAGVDVQAQFVDARGVAIEPALEALEVWVPRPGLEVGDCQLRRHGDDIGARAGEPARLRLYDIGDITVQSPKEYAIVEPTQLPDLLGSFYGVVYESQWTESPDDRFIDYYPGGEYRFDAPGTDQAGGLDATMTAPEPVAIVGANGAEIRDETFMDVRADDKLELVWTSEGASAIGDEIFIDLSTGYGPGHVRVQCRAEDEGAFAVPRTKLQALSDVSDAAELELRRVRHHQTSMEGLETVDVNFATKDRVEIRF